jgi:hypothetical protein
MFTGKPRFTEDFLPMNKTRHGSSSLFGGRLTNELSIERKELPQEEYGSNTRLRTESSRLIEYLVKDKIRELR